MSSRSRGRGRGYMGRGGGFGGSSHHRGDDRRGGGGFHRGGGRGFRGNSNFSHRGSSQEHHRGMSRHREDHSSRDHHNSGRNDRHPQRREDSSSRGREEYMGPRKPRSPPHPHPSSYRKTDQILSKLAPDEQEALTKVLIDTVLQKTQGRDNRSFRDDHDGRSRDHSRDMNERRPSRYMGREFHRGSREGFRGGGYRGRGGRGNRHDNGPHTRLGMHEQPMRRKFDDEDEFTGPPHKRSRLSEDQPGAKDDSRIDGYDRQKSFMDQRERGGGSGGGPQFRRQLFELNCPHCPGHMSITMDDYKYHLSSKIHEKSMERLSRTHSQMLLRMRREQRTQQKELEEDYLKQNPDQAEISITKFCSICKLNFRCLGGDVKEGLVSHCKSRLHKMQQNYLHPRCVVCSAVSDDPKRRFKSRMVYEHHVASISHMKRKNESMDKLPEELVGEDVEDVDLDGFMTVDSVGDEEMPCEESEETMKESEEIEKTKEEGTEEMAEEEETTEGDPQINTEGEKEGSFKPVGLSYVKAVKVFFCKLCFLNIKDGGIKRHCGTPAHRNKYFELMRENEEKEAKEKKEEAGEGKEEKEGEEAEKSKDGEKGKEETDISEKEYETYNNKYNRFNDEEEEDEEEVDFEGVFNEEGEEEQDEEQDLWNEVEDDLQAVKDTNEEEVNEEKLNGTNESEKMEEGTEEKKETEEEKETNDEVATEE